MRKTEKLNMIANYCTYAAKVNVHQKVHKGLNCGADGRAFEMVIKAAMGNFRFDGVAKAGRTDTTKKIDGKQVTFEIKTGCGELGILDESGNIVKTCLTADYVIYAPQVFHDSDYLKQAYVMSAEDFIQGLSDCGLVRRKASSNMNTRKKNGQDWYYDRLAIQSFLNSGKATDRMYEMLDTHGVRYDKWLKERGL